MSQITLHSVKWHKINYLLQLDKSYLRENLEQQSQVPFPLKTRPQMGPSTCPFVYVLQEVKFRGKIMSRSIIPNQLSVYSDEFSESRT